ncbi:MAG: Uma2 family endonuclease [bacterium]|nr:Uma2 family endonuclease [bacterium]
MSTVVAGPLGVDIEYPEGPRVPEGDLQTRRRMELVIALRRWLAARPDAWVCSDINIYYRQGEPDVVVAPDVAVAFGVDRGALEGRRTYKVWEAGAPPAWALEIASHSTYKRDLHAKPASFAELGVAEYWRLDPTGGDYFEPPLEGERRRRGRWEPIAVAADADGTLTARSDVLGLELHWQPPKLRLYDPAAGAWLLDADDLHDAHEAEAAGRRAAEARAAAAEAELAALRRRLGPPTA